MDDPRRHGFVIVCIEAMTRQWSPPVIDRLIICDLRLTPIGGTAPTESQYASYHKR
jgi:hypothetical protein